MDVVTYGADATQFFDVHRQMIAAADRTSSSIGNQRGFDGFLQGEHRVTHQAKFLTQSLLEARSAADVLQAGLQAAVFSTRIPLAGAIVGIAVAEGLKVLVEQFEKTKKAYNELQAEMTKPLGIEVQKSATAIGTDMDKLREKLTSFKKEAYSTGSTILTLFSTPMGTFAPAGGRADEIIANVSARLVSLARAQADAELRVVEIKRDALEISADSAAMEKAQLDYENARAELFANAFKPGADQVNIFKRLAALEVEKRVTIETIRARRSAENESLAHARELADIQARGLGKQDATIAKLTSELAYRLRILEAAKKLGDIKGIAAANVGVAQAQADVSNARQQFLLDLGSGRLIAQFAQEGIEKGQREAAERLIAELRADREKGVNLGPNARKILDEADKLDKASAGGLAALGGQDFSGLAALGNLPFSGLQSLNGLTITIQ